MLTLADLKMDYVDVQGGGTEITHNGATLECTKVWTIGKLVRLLPAYTLEMLEWVNYWLQSDVEIKAGNYLKIWVET